jgi:hypothetical protein
MRSLLSALFLSSILFSSGVYAQTSLPTCPGGESGGGGKPYIATFYRVSGVDYVEVTYVGGGGEVAVCSSAQTCAYPGYNGSTLTIGYQSISAGNGYIYVKDVPICGAEIN